MNDNPCPCVDIFAEIDFFNDLEFHRFDRSKRESGFRSKPHFETSAERFRQYRLAVIQHAYSRIVNMRGEIPDTIIPGINKHTGRLGTTL